MYSPEIDLQKSKKKSGLQTKTVNKFQDDTLNENPTN